MTFDITLAVIYLFKLLFFFTKGDAYHLTAPSEDGRGAIRCMKGALRDANLQTKDISYINAHATSTPMGKIFHFYFIVFKCTIQPEDTI